MQIFVAECVVCARGQNWDERRNVQIFYDDCVSNSFGAMTDAMFLSDKLHVAISHKFAAHTLTQCECCAFTVFFESSYYQREREREWVGEWGREEESGVQRSCIWTHLRNFICSCRLPLIVGSFKLLFAVLKMDITKCYSVCEAIFE